MPSTEVLIFYHNMAGAGLDHHSMSQCRWTIYLSNFIYGLPQSQDPLDSTEQKKYRLTDRLTDWLASIHLKLRGIRQATIVLLERCYGGWRFCVLEA